MALKVDVDGGDIFACVVAVCVTVLIVTGHIPAWVGWVLGIFIFIVLFS